jgi:nucleoside-diphosphate-sugar epimerase
MKNILVCGAGGFIGSHMVKRLKSEGNWVRGIDLKMPDFSPTEADQFVVGDLREPNLVFRELDEQIDEIYQFAADMGGAGYIFTGEHDFDIMHNSVTINSNIASRLKDIYTKTGKKIKVFYSSSACMYPAYNQEDPENPKCSEDSAYPAAPDSEYGWEKLFSERLYLSLSRNYGIPVRVARYHNIFGPEGTWRGGKEKAPAALCRKAAIAEDGTDIEIWGDGKQTRSFLYIDECIEATRRFMDNPSFEGPVNIGSEEMIAINDFAKMAIDISGKQLKINNIDGPVGVRGRNSDNTLLRQKLNWEPTLTLREGMNKTFSWIKTQLENK